VGEPVAIADSIGATATSYAAFSASDTGVLVHSPRFDLTGELRWFDRRGADQGAAAGPAEYLDFELGPTDRAVAVSRLDPDLSTADIWLIDLDRRIQTRLTSDAGNDASVLWSPDGATIVFKSNRLGHIDVYEKRPNGAADERLVLATGSNVITTDWSPDGRYLLFTDTSPTGFDIWAWLIHGKEKPRRVVHTSLDAIQGRFSPDGRSIAYASDESGQLQVYVEPFPPTGDKKQISSDGGAEPRWRRDGAELFYLDGTDQLMSVAIPRGNPFNAAVPQRLFQTRIPIGSNPYRSNYAVTGDGQRFLVNTAVDHDPTPIHVVLNWTGLLKR